MAEWIITCNTKAYDVDGAFNKFNVIEWKQSTNVEVDEIVYIYVGSPVSAISYKCKAVKVNMAEATIDDSEFVIDDTNYGNYGRYMRLQLLEKLSRTELSYAYLIENGLKTVQGPSKVSKELEEYLLSVMLADTDDAEISNLLSGKSSVLIDSKIKQFIKKIPQILPRENDLELLREKFVNDYTMNKLMNMTKEEYVVGFGSKESFCYRLETELQGLGDIHGSTSIKFGLYYGKSGDDTIEEYRWSKRFGNSPDEVLQEIKKQIVYLRMNGEKKDLEAIRNCELAPLLRGKILSVYFPEDYLCIFAEEHLNYFLNRLDIEVTSNDDILDKQSKLLEWKKSKPEMQEWSNHVFTCFLYDAFGRPFEEKKDKDIQEARDNEYPRDYVVKLGVTISQWKELLKNSQVFKEEDIELLKRIYLSDNHATTCYDLGIQDGVSPSSYIMPVVALAKRISAALSLPPIVGENGKQIWWRVPFWGQYREDGRFEWKLRPKLAKALALLYPELTTSADFEAEQLEDNNLVEELKQANVANAEGFEYSGKPKERSAPVYTNGHKTYPRDRQTAVNALAHANYQCEIDGDHPTFIRKKSNKKYTEPHHLIPMAFSEEFDVSLDIEENIVSLCSICHNQVHYGKDADVLLCKLYEERKAALEIVGIKITLTRLLEMYGYIGE